MPENTSNSKVKTPRLKLMSRLLKYLWVHKYLLLAAFAMTLPGNLLALAGPYLSGLAIDMIDFGKGRVDLKRIIFLCVLMAALYLTSAALSYLQSRVMIRISRKVVFKMRSDVFSKISEMSVGYFDSHQAGDILSRVSYDIDTINTSLSTDLVQVLASFVTVIGALVMMLAISPVLVLVFAITVPLSIILTKKITGFTRPLFRKRSAKLGELNGFVEEMIGGQKTLRAYNREESTLRRLDVQNEETVQAYYKAEYYGSTVGPTVNFINNLSLSLVIFFGTILMLKRGITIGNISSFVLYSRKFSGPINEVANIIGELQAVFSAAERVFTLLDDKPEPPDAEGAVELTDIDGDVKIEDVSFGYTEGETVIKDLSLHAKKGALIAIVGPTGAGKSTIINLLMRFYDFEKGTITLDGKSIKSIKKKSLRLAYSMVLQDTWLFSGTVYENIAYGREGASLEEVKRVCRAAGVHEFIENLPKGYDTVLSDDGGNISKGQKQLITIARAMLLDSPLLILDEATSNVDTKTELQIQKVMRTMMKDRTCFVVAHRLSTIRNADLILVVRDGRIIEQGTHDELMSSKSFYSEIFNAQFL